MRGLKGGGRLVIPPVNSLSYDSQTMLIEYSRPQEVRTPRPRPSDPRAPGSPPRPSAGGLDEQIAGTSDSDQRPASRDLNWLMSGVTKVAPPRRGGRPRRQDADNSNWIRSRSVGRDSLHLLGLSGQGEGGYLDIDIRNTEEAV